jgi:hypothetical protein
MFLEYRKDGGRDALGAFVVGKAPDALTILKDLIPVFWGWRLGLCPSVRMTGGPVKVISLLGPTQGAWPF